MDGYAVCDADLSAGQFEFRVSGNIYEGQPKGGTLKVREACRVMTGAPVPRGADRVIMVEYCKVDGEGVFGRGRCIGAEAGIAICDLVAECLHGLPSRRSNSMRE